MGTILRILIALMGGKDFSRAYLSDVSKTISYLPVPNGTRWFWGGALHLLPVVLVLAFVFLFRSPEITHSKKEIITLFLAATWVWIGPVLIWYYERYVLPQFARDCKKIIVDPINYEAVRRAAYENVYKLRFSRYFIPIWVAIVALTFYSAENYLRGFGLRDHNDVLWWIILFGVALIAGYSSLGFCLAYKALCLTQLVARARLDRNIYHADGILGLSFIGEFSFKTSAMFFSGWLFAPLLILSTKSNTLWGYLTSVQISLIATYFLFTVIYFLAPIYLIHYKILKEKALRADTYYQSLNNLLAKSVAGQTDEESKRFKFLKRIIEEVRAIPNWPLRLDTAVKFGATSVSIPTLVSAFSAILKLYHPS
jgi:hypothetical protein